MYTLFFPLSSSHSAIYSKVIKAIYYYKAQKFSQYVYIRWLKYSIILCKSEIPAKPKFETFQQSLSSPRLRSTSSDKY
jgi:hypothetical protein